MKKLLYILILISGTVNAQIVNIPDANFKAALIAAGIDTNADGEIQIFETSPVTDLHIENANIADLTGIESFPSLVMLFCKNNALTLLDFSTNPNLNYLDCSNNQISFLNISQNTNLWYLDCDGNNLSNINLINNANLYRISLFNNHLTNLDVSNAPNLHELYCGGNELTSLYLGSNPALSILDCSYNAITDLQVNMLSNLTRLACTHNELTTINVSGLQNLLGLECMYNHFTTINLSNLPNLVDLWCGFNPITTLDLHELTNLKQLLGRTMQLTSIDFTGLNQMLYVDVVGNQLTSIDISMMPDLEKFLCGNNPITSLDVSMLSKIKQFNCEYSQLTTLDVSSLVQLESLACDGNQLTQLFVKNGRGEFLSFTNNPDLLYICADESQVAAVQTAAIANNPNTVVSSYCSFTPGGNYNSITGTVRFDFDNNGCDTNDFFAKNVRLDLSDGLTPSATFVNGSGGYTLYAAIGDYTLNATHIENPSYFDISPANIIHSFPALDNTVVTQDFCVTANGIHPDLEIVIAPKTGVRPGFDAVYEIVYKNKGNQPLSGNITFTYDDEKLDFVSSTMVPDAQNTGLLNWNYSDLQPFENRSFEVTLHANTPTQTPPLNIGDILNFEATITPVIADEIPADNLFAFHQTAVGSYDPNAITCLEGASVAPSEIGNYLHYMINFENTGTATAENIVVKTEIDPDKFDIDSLQLINTSALVDARIIGSIAEFIFKNIDLDIGGHGHILLKIKTNAALHSGDMVSKRADIFFDYNAPIDTGMADTVFQLLANTNFNTDQSVGIYPNPAENAVTVKSVANIKIHSFSLMPAGEY